MINTQSKPKQHRISRQEAKEFAHWLFIDQNMERLLDMTSEQIRLLYHKQSGIIVSKRFIEDQFDRWIVINNNVYKKNEPWTHPKITSESIQAEIN